MGNPYEENFFYEGWRDYGQGEPRPRDVVHDPNCGPMSVDPATQKRLDDLFCRFRAELARPLVFMVKRPAFVEPPFFSKPLTKAKNGLTVAPGQIGSIFDKVIDDRQRAILSCVGIDLAPLAPLFAGQLEFWFQRGSADGGESVPNAEIIPVFDDQTPTSYGGTTPIAYGRTTVLPGSVEIPYEMFQNGLQFGVRGRSRLQMLVENKSGVSVVIRGILGFYEYWSSAPKGASEWASGDLQL